MSNTADKHAHICELRDTIGRAYLALIPLPTGMEERDRHSVGDNRLLAYLDSLPDPQPDQDFDGYMAERAAICRRHSAAVREIAERRSTISAAFSAYLRAASEARELVRALAPWLPGVAATHGMDAPGEWTEKLLLSLAWGVSDGPATTSIEDVERYQRVLGYYWGRLKRLADWTAHEGNATAARSLVDPPHSAGHQAERQAPPAGGGDGVPPDPPGDQFPTVTVGINTFSLYVGRDSEGFLINGDRYPVADANQAWLILREVWPPAEGREVDGRRVRKSLGSDGRQLVSQWVGKWAHLVRGALEPLTAAGFPFIVRAGGGNFIWCQSPDRQ